MMGYSVNIFVRSYIFDTVSKEIHLCHGDFLTTQCHNYEESTQIHLAARCIFIRRPRLRV